MKKHISDKISIVLALTAFSSKTHFSRIRFEKIESNMPDNSKVFCDVVDAHTTIIFSENHIQAPMQRVFDAPV